MQLHQWVLHLQHLQMELLQAVVQLWQVHLQHLLCHLLHLQLLNQPPKFLLRQNANA